MALQATETLAGRSLYFWRIFQVSFFMIGLGIFLALIFFPTIGIHAFWNVLIPVAPALLVIAAGLWRNICPMASIALSPRHTGFSKRRRLKVAWQGRLNLMGVILLLLIVPLRHVVLDTNGPATAIALGLLAVTAFLMGRYFDWKSGWCSGLCPVLPVEKLYGAKVVRPMPNAHCGHCHNCVIPCPDSKAKAHPLMEKKTRPHRWAGYLVAGGFPGFIWGWFHVADYHGMEGWNHLLSAYGIPFLGLAVSLSVFMLLKRILPAKREGLLINISALASVACYYWYRLPALIGFGLFPGDGMLVDLSSVIPVWIPILIQLVITLFFTWWLLFRPKAEFGWTVRPPYQRKMKAAKSMR